MFSYFIYPCHMKPTRRRMVWEQKFSWPYIFRIVLLLTFSWEQENFIFSIHKIHTKVIFWLYILYFCPHTSLKLPSISVCHLLKAMKISFVLYLLTIFTFVLELCLSFEKCSVVTCCKVAYIENKPYQIIRNSSQ